MGCESDAPHDRHQRNLPTVIAQRGRRTAQRRPGKSASREGTQSSPGCGVAQHKERTAQLNKSKFMEIKKILKEHMLIHEVSLMIMFYVYFKYL